MASINQIPHILIPAASVIDPAVIPSVDLSATGAAADACRTVGLFRTTNHGVPAGMVDSLEASAMAFFALLAQDKLKLGVSGGQGDRGMKGDDVGWLEYLLLSVSSNSVAVSSLLPQLRATLEEYTAAVKKVGGRVLELMAARLGVDGAPLRRMVAVAGEAGDEVVRLNHCPPCPPAAREFGHGVTWFADPQVISVVWSNCTTGLQIELDDGSSALVHPDPESYFVVVGDSLQALTNGRFKSVRHRVAVPQGARSQLSSFIYFGSPAPWQLIEEALKQVMREGEQSLCTKLTWDEYKKPAYVTALGDHRLGPLQWRTKQLPDEPSSTSADPPHHAGVGASWTFE